MRHILEQYTALQDEQEDLIRRIQSLDARLLNIETNVIVSDTVSRGKKGHQSLGIVRIEGFPSQDYTRRKQALKKLKETLSRKSDELLEMLNDVEEYMDSIDDGEIRALIRYRYIDGMSWRDVGKAVHMNEDAARKKLERYLQK